MERRRKAAARKTASRVEQPASNTQEAILSLLPNIAELVDYGGITIGQMEPVGCVAVANSEHDCLAMLRRRKNESLGQLLVRLDHAVAKAINEDIYTDEINAPIK
jgi:hypothetical protein